LLALPRGTRVDVLVEACAPQDLAGVVECAAFGVDYYPATWGESCVFDLWDCAACFHVRRVAACAEDAADANLGVAVCGCDQGSCGVVD